MKYAVTIVLMCLFNFACDGTDPVMKTEPTDYPANGYQEKVAFDPSFEGEDGEVLLTHPETEPYCRRFHAEEVLDLVEDEPHGYLLYGMNGETYCVDVYRMSGYITLSKEEGTVRRDDDHFEWCVETPGLATPLRLLVRSLTPEARYTMKLRRE